jgi:hypothetical protein
MTAALIYKEFRETLAIAGLGLAVLLWLALSSMDYAPVPGIFGQRYQGSIPFVHDSFGSQYKNITACLALALGFSQSLRDFWGDSQLFLLHRPVSRRRIYGAKLVVGLATCLMCGLAPLVIYAWWAATPGTHASPFEWSMTRDVWVTWLWMTAIYLGAFLSGIRPAAWFGTRFAPLAAAILSGFLSWWEPATVGGVVFLVVANVVLILAIFRVVELREFV